MSSLFTPLLTRCMYKNKRTIAGCITTLHGKYKAYHAERVQEYVFKELFEELIKEFATAHVGRVPVPR